MFSRADGDEHMKSNPFARGLVTLAIVLCCSGLEGRDLYVAPEGNDQWSGTMPAVDSNAPDGPFATLERARDEVRRWRDAGASLKEPVTIHIRGGDYVRDQAFRLTPNDSGAEQSPVTYRAYRNETVRLIGGRELTGFARVESSEILKRLEPSAREAVRQVNLKSIGVTDFGDPVQAGKRLELFFDDQPMTLARWPNDGYVTIGKLLGGKPRKSHNLTGDAVGKFGYDYDRPKRWEGENDIRLHGYWFWDWSAAYQTVDAIDTENNVITLKPPYHHYGYLEGQRYFALNLLAELDSPGEWYLDRSSGILYFWPPGPIESARTYVSLIDSLVDMKDVSHTTFQGITFEFNRGDAITVNGGTHNRIAGCVIRNIGSDGIVIQGGTDHTITSCDLYNLGDNGISIDAGDRKTLTPCRHNAINNHVHHYSRTSATYRGAFDVRGVGCRVAHNLVHDAPHVAIWMRGNDHLIEYNEVHHVYRDTDDAGALYIGRDYTWRSNTIRYNFFHHIGDFKSRVGVQAIYLDDFTSDTTVFGNICHKVYRAVLLGGGRKNRVENNVLVDSTIGIHLDSRGLGWAKNYFNGGVTTLETRLEAMPYREPPWSERYPELLTLYEDEPAVPKYNIIRRNIAVDNEKWLDLRFDKDLPHSIVDVRDNLTNEDPGFVDPSNGNFQLKLDSPAWKLGFERIPVEKIGLFRDEFRTTLPSGAQQYESE